MSHVTESEDKKYIAFEGSRRIGSGSLRDVVPAAKQALDQPEAGTVLIFDAETSHRAEVDFLGSLEEVLARLAPDPPQADEARGPGRPKLGVVAREVTLLPKHWGWLNAQPGGASVALRKIVTEARRANEAKDRQRQAQESAYRFITVLAGDLPDFEEASRALFANDAERFRSMTETWPEDVRDHARELLETGLFTG